MSEPPLLTSSSLSWSSSDPSISRLPFLAQHIVGSVAQVNLEDKVGLFPSEPNPAASFSSLQEGWPNFIYNEFQGFTENSKFNVLRGQVPSLPRLDQSLDTHNSSWLDWPNSKLQQSPSSENIACLFSDESSRPLPLEGQNSVHNEIPEPVEAPLEAHSDMQVTSTTPR